MTVKLERDSRLLRIFIGEMDKYEHRSLYEALVFAAKEQGIAGATVLRALWVRTLSITAFLRTRCLERCAPFTV